MTYYLVFQTFSTEVLNRFIDDDKEEKGSKWKFFFDDREFLNDYVTFIGTIDEDEQGRAEENHLEELTEVYDALGPIPSHGVVIFKVTTFGNIRLQPRMEQQEFQELVKNVILGLKDYGYARIDREDYETKLLKKFVRGNRSVFYVQPNVESD